MIKAKELRAILAAVPDDQDVFIHLDDGGEYSIESYKLSRYADGAIELVLFTDESCGLEI